MNITSKKTILITGSRGFLGKNLTSKINHFKQYEIITYDLGDDYKKLVYAAEKCSFICHFAAVHRPKFIDDFKTVNICLLKDILNIMKDANNLSPFLLTSSIQAIEKTPYGISKFTAERMVIRRENKNLGRAIVYRLTNIFGRWAKPNNHSVVANFCYNTIKGLPLCVSMPSKIMKFYYIDDVIDSILENLDGDFLVNKCKDGFYRLSSNNVLEISLGKLADCIQKFSKGGKPKNLRIERLLYKTYMEYVKEYGD